MFDVSSIYLRHNFAQVWALASDKLTSLEIGYISSLMVTELLCPNFESHQSSNRIQPSILPNIHKLCLSIDYITDAMVGTISTVTSLASNEDLEVLDLRDCRNLGDESLRAISTLPKVRTSLLDGSDISDVGLSYLRPVVISTLISLSVRGCKKLTDKCISALFDGSSKLELQELDLSNLPYLSDNAVLLLAKSRIPPLLELRMRQCPLIGDTSVMALASMQIDEERWHGNCLRLLDLFNCGGIYPAFVSVVEETIFSKAEMVGSYGPFLHVSCHGEELGVEQGDTADDVYMQDFDEMDELEQWLAEDDYVDEDMVNAEAVE
ncbi:hypothetical protein COP1_003452 [Malus domestica]